MLYVKIQYIYILLYVNILNYIEHLLDHFRWLGCIPISERSYDVKIHPQDMAWHLVEDMWSHILCHWYSRKLIKLINNLHLSLFIMFWFIATFRSSTNITYHALCWLNHIFIKQHKRMKPEHFPTKLYVVVAKDVYQWYMSH